MPGWTESLTLWERCVRGSSICVVALNPATGKASVDLEGAAAGNGCSSHWSGIRSGRMRLFAVRNTRTGSKSWIFSLGGYSVLGSEGSSRDGLVATYHLLAGRAG